MCSNGQQRVSSESMEPLRRFQQGIPEMSGHIYINFYYSVFLEFSYFILVIVVNLLVCLIHKLNFILGIYV